MVVVPKALLFDPKLPLEVPPKTLLAVVATGVPPKTEPPPKADGCPNNGPPLEETGELNAPPKGLGADVANGGVDPKAAAAAAVTCVPKTFPDPKTELVVVVKPVWLPPPKIDDCAVVAAGVDPNGEAGGFETNAVLVGSPKAGLWVVEIVVPPKIGGCEVVPDAKIHFNTSICWQN